MKKIFALALSVVFAAGLALAAEKAAAPKAAEKAAAPAAAEKAATKADDKAPAAAAEPAKDAKAEKIDINTATAEELQKIKGIGPEYSKKIIDNRPFTKKDQLKSKKIIPEALYEKIKDLIIAKQPLKEKGAAAPAAAAKAPAKDKPAEKAPEKAPAAPKK